MERTAIKYIYADENVENIHEAKELAKRLNLDIILGSPDKSQTDLMLYFGKEGLELRGNNLQMRGDFTKMLPRLKTSNLRGELLIKAAKIKGELEGMTIVDATAGMGEDSLLLAASGLFVKLYEYNPIIASLLRDTVERASKIPELSDIAARMEVHNDNSIEALPKLNESPDLVLLDPMFPGRQKSGLVKKKFQLLHNLEQPCMNEGEILKAAIEAKPRKILIKRPIKAPYLAGMKPSYSIEGKGIRYDCIVL